MATLRERVHDLLEARPDDPASRLVNRVLVVLIVLNVLAVIAESMGDFAERYAAPLRAFEVLSLGVFGVEYLLRLWSVGLEPRFAGVSGRLRWMATPYAVIDLLALLPGVLLFVTPGLVPIRDLRFLRLLRLTRLLKLGRYSESVRILGRVFRNKREELLMAFFLVLVALVVASSLLYHAEREAQPDKFGSIPAAMWWGIVTLTTIGYGDVVPITPMGKLVGSFAAVGGILALALPVGILASGFTDELQTRRKAADAHAHGHACPHCGKAMPPRS